jgi:hypothetical protein
MTRSARAAFAALVPALLSIWWLATAPRAAASCALPARESPHRFTGAVVETDDQRRTATVHTDDGWASRVCDGPGLA